MRASNVGCSVVVPTTWGQGEGRGSHAAGCMATWPQLYIGGKGWWLWGAGGSCTRQPLPLTCGAMPAVAITKCKTSPRRCCPRRAMIGTPASWKPLIPTGVAGFIPAIPPSPMQTPNPCWYKAGHCGGDQGFAAGRSARLPACGMLAAQLGSVPPGLMCSWPGTLTLIPAGVAGFIPVIPPSPMQTPGPSQYKARHFHGEWGLQLARVPCRLHMKHGGSQPSRAASAPCAGSWALQPAPNPVPR